MTSYLLRDIPAPLWRAVKLQAAKENKPIRRVLFELLASYTGLMLSYGDPKHP